MWKPGQSGNPAGRRRGETARGAFRRQVEASIPAIVEKLVQQALEGDIAAAKLLLDRLLPPLRPIDEPVTLKLPTDPAGCAEVILRALARGKLTPVQASVALQVTESARDLAEHDELYRRLGAVEEWMRNSAK
jgi:hypothetical protein